MNVINDIPKALSKKLFLGWKLEWELSGLDFEESGEIFLQLTRPENDTQIRVNSKDCQLIQNGNIQIPKPPRSYTLEDFRLTNSLTESFSLFPTEF